MSANLARNASSDLVDESVSESVSKSVSESVSELVSESVSELLVRQHREEVWHLLERYYSSEIYCFIQIPLI